MAAMRAAMAHGILDSMQFITASGMSESEAMQIMVTTQYLDTFEGLLEPQVHAGATSP